MHLLKLTGTTLSTAVILAAGAAWLVFSLPATGCQALVVPTHSMQPSFPAGSLVFVRRVPIASLRAGDVITYRSPLDARKTITHRIVRQYLIGGRIPGFVTKGDANRMADVPVPSGDVEGKVIGSVPYAGTALEWARTWPGTVVLVYVPALLITVGEIRRLRDYYRRFVVYRVLGYSQHPPRPFGVLRAASLAAIFMIILSMAVWTPPLVLALSHSNTVVLARNHLKVKHGRSAGQNEDNGNDGGSDKDAD